MGQICVFWFYILVARCFSQASGIAQTLWRSRPEGPNSDCFGCRTIQTNWFGFVRANTHRIGPIRNRGRPNHQSVSLSQMMVSTFHLERMRVQGSKRVLTSPVTHFQDEFPFDAVMSTEGSLLKHLLHDNVIPRTAVETARFELCFARMIPARTKSHGGYFI